MFGVRGPSGRSALGLRRPGGAVPARAAAAVAAIVLVAPLAVFPVAHGTCSLSARVDRIAGAETGRAHRAGPAGAAVRRPHSITTGTASPSSPERANDAPASMHAFMHPHAWRSIFGAQTVVIFSNSAHNSDSSPMSQTFHPSANGIARIMLFGLIVLVAASGYLVYQTSKSPYVTRAFEARQQPIQFSHERHVAGNGLDCRYCHTSVEIGGVRRHSADQDLHELPLADPLEQPVPRAGPRRASPTTCRSSGSRSTTCRISCTSTTAST